MYTIRSRAHVRLYIISHRQFVMRIDERNNKSQSNCQFSIPCASYSTDMQQLHPTIYNNFSSHSREM